MFVRKHDSWNRNIKGYYNTVVELIKKWDWNINVNNRVSGDFQFHSVINSSIIHFMKWSYNKLVYGTYTHD